MNIVNIVNLKKVFNKYSKLSKLLILASIFSILFVVSRDISIREFFEIENDQLQKINNALDSIILCSEKRCKKEKPKTFGDFKRTLNYPNFSVILFNDLLNARKESKMRFTTSDFNAIVEKGKHNDSFKIIEKIENGQGECAQSFTALDNLITEQRKKDEAAYQAALAKWNAARDAAMNVFRGNPVLWKQYCGSSPGSCPMGAFFRTQAGQKHSFDFQRIPNTTFDACQRACLQNDRCDWTTFEINGNCWLNSANRYPNANINVGIKSNTGIRVRPNGSVSGCDFSGCQLTNQSQASCFASCQSNPQCDIVEYRKSDRACFMKRANHNPGDKQSAFKNTRATGAVTFPDNHQYFKDVLPNPKPQRKDFKLNTINTGSIICQVCAQAAGKFNADGSQVSYKQLQQCTIDADNRPTSSTTALPTTTGQDPQQTRRVRTDDTSSNKSSDSGMPSTTIMLAIGVGILLMCIVLFGGGIAIYATS